MPFDRAVIESLLPDVTPTPVAHYTRIGNLCHFIPAGATGWASAWATPVQFLNDRMELSLGLEVLQDIANKRPQSSLTVRTKLRDLLQTQGSLEADAFQMSFSGNPDELGQWRGYASDGLGCSIVTDATAIKAVADVAGWVLYNEKPQRSFASKVLKSLRNEHDVDTIEKVLIAAASYIKQEGFRPEQEFRLLKFPRTLDIKFRETGDRLVPYIDYLDITKSLPIHKIVIGPGWQLSTLGPVDFARNHVVQGIQRLLDARGLTSEIKSSNIPYDPK